MTVYYRYAATPIGKLLLAASDEGVVRIGFEREKHASRPLDEWMQNDARLAYVKKQLDEYFAGKRREFDLPLAPSGTEFQKRVWSALRDIPYGRTCSYGELAERIGKPSASRAVGAANGANPIPIIIPCHRVIGASGALTGFGGGIDVKRYLLELEGAKIDTAQQALAFAR